MGPGYPECTSQSIRLFLLPARRSIDAGRSCVWCWEALEYLQLEANVLGEGVDEHQVGHSEREAEADHGVDPDGPERRCAPHNFHPGRLARVEVGGCQSVRQLTLVAPASQQRELGERERERGLGQENTHTFEDEKK